MNISLDWLLVLLTGLMAAEICVADTTEPLPPEIVIIEDGGASNHTLSAGARTHYLLPRSVKAVSFKCQAKYPVMWKDIDSVVYQDIGGAESERIVNLAHFDQPETYEYSMTVNWHPEGPERVDAGIQLECLAVAQRGAPDDNTEQRTARLIVSWDRKLQAVLCSLGAARSTANVTKESASDLILSVTQLGEGRTRSTCCLGPGAHAETDVASFRLGYGYCPKSVLCITWNVNITEMRWSETNTETGSGKCATLTIGSPPDKSVPPFIACGQALSENVTSSWIVLEMLATDTFTWLEYQSVLDNNRAVKELTRSDNSNVTSPVTFYTGDIIFLKCYASTVFYAKGIIWELGFKNGTRGLVGPGQDITMIYSSKMEVGLRLTLMDRYEGLNRISCHVPPWNTTSWVTHSVSVSVKASLMPVLMSSSPENVTFYSHETVRLFCDFEGQPTPELDWEMASSVYTLKVAESNEFTTIAKLSVNVQNTIDNPPSDFHFPGEFLSCSATNLAGNSTKRIYVQAIQSFKPALANSAREAVTFYVGDRDAVLNCSLTQGVPSPTFVWQRHGANISNDDDEQLQAETSELWSVLVFKTVRLEDDAEYSCTARNALGSVIKEFNVRIRERLVLSPPQAEAPQVHTHWNKLTIAFLVLFIASVLVISGFTVWWSCKNRQFAEQELSLSTPEWTMASQRLNWPRTRSSSALGLHC